MTLLYDSPILKEDAYKVGHQKLYPKNLSYIYSVLIPRKNSFYPWSDKMVSFGYQLFVMKELRDDWNENFFNQPLEDVLETYSTVIGTVLGPENVELNHIKELHELGYLPLEVKALPEGSIVPMQVPTLTIINTDKRFPWLTNFVETILLSETFVTTTVATTAHEFRKRAIEYGKKYSDDLGYVDYQFHDFSERGQHGNGAGRLSGLSHITSFKGSDVLQAPLDANKYYQADLANQGQVSASVIASEHSVMESYGLDQYKTYETLIKDNPTGILSLVSDTYDYWEVINDVLPSLKDLIMSRDGKLVLRPDSGDMETNILGTLDSLWDTFGGTVNSKGMKVLDSHVGLLYGEGITLDNVNGIFDVMVEHGYSPENIVLGVGAYVYSVNVSRDSFAQAIKAQVAVYDDGTEKLIFKDPKTDTDHLKRSLKGAVAVVDDSEGNLKVIDGLTLEQANSYQGNKLHTIFKDGEVYNEVSLSDVRDILEKDIEK